MAKTTMITSAIKLMDTEGYRTKIRAYYNNDIDIESDYTTYGLILRLELLQNDNYSAEEIVDASEPDSAEYDAYLRVIEDNKSKMRELIDMLYDRGIDASCFEEE